MPAVSWLLRFELATFARLFLTRVFPIRGMPEVLTQDRLDLLTLDQHCDRYLIALK
jgi:hypothetical protein